MAAPITAAASAYGNALKLGSSSGGAGGESFGDLVKGALQDAVDTQKSGEKQAMARATKTADLLDVTHAVANAELSLQTVVALRDKVIAAYQEVIRMPI